MLFSNILTNPIISKIQIFVTSNFRTPLETAPVCSRIKLLFFLNYIHITINFSRFVSLKSQPYLPPNAPLVGLGEETTDISDYRFVCFVR